MTEFAAFVNDINYKMGGGATVSIGREWKAEGVGAILDLIRSANSWAVMDFSRTTVTLLCAYASWLSVRSGMSYRRSATQAPGTSRWRRRNRSKLSRWLPDCVVCDDRRLTHVLLHGSDGFGTCWTPDWLSPQAGGRVFSLSRI